MRPERWPHGTRDRPRRNRGGFALVGALALLVALGSTGALMLRLSAVQEAGTSLVIQGTRATWAARSGIEWGLQRAVDLDDCPGSTPPLDLSEGELAGFRVLVHCSASRHFEGGEERLSVVLRAEASSGAPGSRDFVYREVQASAVF